MKNYIEIIIIKSDDGFIAKSPMFKECEGSGLTQKTALSRLSTAIGHYIGKISKQSFKTIFHSDHYTEVLFDTATSDSQTNYTQKLLYPLTPQHSHLLKMSRVRLKSIQSMNGQLLFPHYDETTQNHSPFDNLFDKYLVDHNNTSTEENTEDTFLFGFPISFN